MRPNRSALSGLLALLCAACAGARGEAGLRATAPEAALAAPLEDATASSHQITLGGAPIAYTATAGHLTATSLAGGLPLAALFYVAYTADGADPATRPVTFCYNGGPGSASVWLHLGSFGPRRLVTGDPAATGATAFPLVDNPECLLDTSDLVFVDAVGTGLSEAVAPNTNRTFWSVDADAAVFRDFIRRYLAVNRREASPLYLFGESYGTPRTAVLANLLGACGRKPTGVILQSSILDYNANGDVGPGVSCCGFLPTYAALGAYYRLDHPAPPDLGGFLGQMRVFTASSYVPAVTAWLGHRTAPEPALTALLRDDTGIAAALWEAELNLAPERFQASLLPATLIGRYDGRVSAPADSPLASEGDPSSTFIAQPFASAIAGCLEALGYGHGADYAVMGEANPLWDFSHDGLALPDTIPDLAAAMARDPALKVLSLNGYHDLATPFYQTELDLARLPAHPNLQIRHYNGGHMVYLDDTSRPQEKADLVAFYRGAPGWTGSPDHALAAPTTRTLARPRPAAAPMPGPNPLFDPFVPPGRRHPRSAPPTRGAALQEQIARKLAPSPSN